MTTKNRKEILMNDKILKDEARKKFLIEKEKFIKILNLKYPEIKIFDILGIKRILCSDLKKYLNIESFPKKYFKSKKTYQKQTYQVIKDVMDFVKFSVCDKEMMEIYGPSGGHPMGRNPHYVIDFHEEMGWTKEFDYPIQVKILVEIIKNTVDTHKFIRGSSEFRLNNNTSTKFRCDYYFSRPKLIIEIDEDRHSMVLREMINDQEKDKLKDLGFDVCHVYASEWNDNKYKSCVFEYIKFKIEKYQPMNYFEIIMKRINEIDEVVNFLGKEIVDSYVENSVKQNSSGFIFPLGKILEQINIDPGSKMYQEIMLCFPSNINNSIFNEDDYEDDDNHDHDDSFFDSDDDSDDDSDSDSDNDSNSGDDSNKKNKNLLLQEKYVYIKNTDYIEKDGEYYVNERIMMEIAIKTSTKLGRRYYNMLIDLFEYIKDVGPKICEEYNKLLIESELSNDKMKKIQLALSETVRNEFIGDLNKLKRMNEMKDFVIEQKYGTDIDRFINEYFDKKIDNKITEALFMINLHNIQIKNKHDEMNENFLKIPITLQK